MPGKYSIRFAVSFLLQNCRGSFEAQKLQTTLLGILYLSLSLSLSLSIKFNFFCTHMAKKPKPRWSTELFPFWTKSGFLSLSFPFSLSLSPSLSLSLYFSNSPTFNSISFADLQRSLLWNCAGDDLRNQSRLKPEVFSRCRVRRWDSCSPGCCSARTQTCLRYQADERSFKYSQVLLVLNVLHVLHGLHILCVFRVLLV